MLFRSDRKSTRLNSSHTIISYAVFCLKKKKTSVGAWAGRARRRGFDHRRPADLHALTPAGHSSMPTGSALLWSGFSFFFFNDRAPPEFYPLSLHDALPI